MITWPAQHCPRPCFLCIAVLFCHVLLLGPPAGFNACFGVQALYHLKMAAHVWCSHWQWLGFSCAEVSTLIATDCHISCRFVILSACSMALDWSAACVCWSSCLLKKMCRFPTAQPCSLLAGSFGRPPFFAGCFRCWWLDQQHILAC